MGWVLATLLTLGGVGWLLFVMPEEDDDAEDIHSPVSTLGTQSVSVNEGMTYNYLTQGWPGDGGINTYIGNIEPTSESTFQWNGWGVIATEVNVDSRGRRYYDLRIHYGNNKPPDEPAPGYRLTFQGPLTQTTNCHESTKPISCRMLNELKRDLEEAIEAGVIVPNGAT